MAKWMSFKYFQSVPESGKVGSVNFNLFLARLFGLPFYSKADSAGRKAVFFAYCATILIGVNFLYLYCEFLDLMNCWGDLDTLTQNACLSFTHIGGVIKTFNCMYRVREILATIELLSDLVAKYVQEPEQRKIFLRHETVIRTISFSYALLVFLTAVLAAIILIINPDVGGSNFPFRALLPSAWPQTIKSLYLFLGVTMNALLIVSIDSLQMNLMVQVQSQLKILNFSLDKLSNMLEPDPVRQLKMCIEHHQLVVRFRNEVESIFRHQVLVQVFTSLAIFGLTGFQATVRPEVNKISIILYFYLCCILTQLFIYCLFANQAMEQSKSLAMKGYFSCWYNFGPKFARILGVFLINAQQPIVFTVGGVFELSLDTFTDILSRSYSYVALLRQLYAD